MSDLLQKCEEYFDTRDFYEVLNIDRSASERQVKKAYHKLSLLVHPDRVEESQKAIATEKFKILGKIHSILQDKQKRKVYDDCGEFDEESASGFDWMDYWRSMFKEITIEDIRNYEKEYIGSDLELRDIKKAYINGKGDMNYIFEMVPFVNCDSEERITNIISELVAKEEVESYHRFFNESPQKKNRRRRRYEKEQKESEKIMADGELVKEMQRAREERMKKTCNFLAQLEAKYGDKKSPKGVKRKSIENGTSPARTRRTTRYSKK